MIPPELRQRLEQAFDAQQAALLGEIVAAAATAAAAAEIAELRSVVQDLGKAQARTEERLTALTEHVRTLTERVGTLTERVEALAEAQRRTEQRLEMLVMSVDKLAEGLDVAVTRIGRMDGHLWELTYREKAGAYFGPLVRRMRLVTPQLLEDAVEDRLTPEEFDEVLRLDMVVSGRPRRIPFDGEVWLAVEISVAIDPHDISRAYRRAQILRRAGVSAIPVVAGERLTADAVERADDENVVVLLNGRVQYWERALARLAAA